MKCAGLPPACGQSALRTSGGSSTFGTPSSTCSVRRPTRIGSRLPGSGVFLVPNQSSHRPQPPSASGASNAVRRVRRVFRAIPITRPVVPAGQLARPRTPFGAVVSCRQAAQCRLRLIRLALAQVQQRELLLGQRVPGIVRGRERLQPRLEQRQDRPRRSGAAPKAGSRGRAAADRPRRRLPRWSHRAAAPGRSPASAFSAASRSRASVA